MPAASFPTLLRRAPAPALAVRALAPQRARAASLSLSTKAATQPPPPSSSSPPPPPRTQSGTPRSINLSKHAGRGATNASPAVQQQASAEQQQIVSDFTSGKFNIATAALAGSGKTHTLMQVAQAPSMASKKITAIMFAKLLKDTSRKKRARLGIKNLTVDSFHSFFFRHYSKDAYHDTSLNDVLVHDVRPILPFTIDALVIDEAQDLTPQLYKAICKIMRDNIRAEPCPILLLGDERQNIFKYKDADARYLTRAEEAFGDVAPDLPFKTLQLSTTFRLTGNMVAFMNAHVLNQDLYRANKAAGDPVRYYCGNEVNVAKKLAADLLELLMDKHDADGKLLVPAKYKPGDVYVLTDSLDKGNPRVRKCWNEVVNTLIEEGIPCGSYHQRKEFEEAQLNYGIGDFISYDKIISYDASAGELLHNQLIFSTAHKVKGLERPLVVVFNFADSIVWDNVRDEDHMQCPNALYMAITRATHELFLVGESVEGGALKFLENTRPLDSPASAAYLDVIRCGPLNKPAPVKAAHRYPTADGLAAHLSAEVECAAGKFLAVQPIAETSASRAMPAVPKQLGSKDVMLDVKQLVDWAVRSFHERQRSGTASKMEQACTACAKRNRTKRDRTVRKYLTRAKLGDGMAMADHLWVAAVYSYMSSGVVEFTEQLLSYDFLQPPQYLPLLDTLAEHFSGAAEYMVDVALREEDADKEDLGGFSKVTGTLDALTDEYIYKLVYETDNMRQDELKLALVGWIWEKSPKGRMKRGPRKLRLLQYRTGELREVASTPEQLQGLASVLLEAKLRGDSLPSDEEWLAECEEIKALFPRRER